MCSSKSVVILLVSLVGLVCGFNLDAENYVRHRQEKSSMFGFTVAMHKERGNSWVLVGAPEASSSQPPDVRKGGAVYRCAIDRDDACQEVPFDRKGHNVDNQGKHIDDKSGQWFGATLNSAGDDGPIVACAPRYVYFASKRDRRDPVGTCYVARGDFGSYSEYSPCRTTLSGYHRQGSCQAGFGAAISKDGRHLFVGGPGSFYWQGQMYSIDAHATFPFTPGKFGGAYGSGQVIQQSLEVRPSVVATKEGSEKDDNSYMGYSVATGDFSGDGEEGVAVGMPRGANLFGKVVLFTWNLTNHQNITGLQLGSYFGYAIAVGDIDGDGTSDLIIGAPLHTENNNEGKYEVGRVYVVYQGKDSSKRFRRLNTLDGFNSKSRFGLSLASLGDINLDGYGDFVVGAPYDGPNERGAVYIYHGSKELSSSKYSQVIFAEDVAAGPGTRSLSTFGFSVSGGIDLDGNNYPDMAVGAYLSDSVYFFRSRPVVKIDAYVRFMTANKQIILDEKNCTLRNKKPVTCTSIDVCINYTGIGVPRTINLDLQYVLDVKNTKNPRLFFLKNENKNTLNESFTLHKDSRHLCNQKIVYIMNDVRDKLTPLEAEIRYSMRESRSFQQKNSRNPNSILIPILDLNSPPMRKDSITIHKNCGPDNICIPDLRLIANSSVEKYLLGSNEKLQFEIIVQNEGEDSFESTFDLQMPPGVDFNKIIQYNKTEVRILCSSLENNTIRCDIGNPLPAGKIARFIIQMTPYHKEGMSPVYDFLLTVNSTNPENSGTVSDNQKNIRIPIWVNSHLELGGKSRPSEVHYNASLYTAEEIKRESDIGPQVIHVYTIKNNGPSDINEAEMVFLWPYATLGGEDLLYLLEQPHTIGNVKCEPAQANYRGYDLEFRKKSIWETIGIDVSKGDFSMAAGQTGEIIIEEGAGTLTSSGGEKVNAKADFDYEQSGDGSLIHQQRRKQQQAGGSTSSGTIVHVGKDTGSGSEVRVETHSSSWNSSHGPGGTYTYSKNSTRYVGPDGKIYYHESTSGDPRLAGAHGITHTSSGGVSSGGSSSSSSGFSSSSTGFSSSSQSGHTGGVAGSSGGHSGGSSSGHSSGSSGIHITGSSSGGHSSQSSGTYSGSGGSQSGGSYSGSRETQYSGSGGSQSGGSYSGSSGSGLHITSSGGHSSQGGHISTSGTQFTQSSSEDGRISSNYGGHSSHNIRPNIIYTSTGKQHGQQGTSFSTSSGSSGSAGGSIDVGGYDSRQEDRRSGQTFRHEDGGRTVYEDGHYPGNKPQSVNKHFDWSRGTSQEESNYGRSNEGGYGRSESGNTRFESTRHGGYSGSGYGGASGHEESINRQESSSNRHESGSSYGSNVNREEETYQNREEETYSRYPDNYDFPYSSEEYTENAAYDEENIRGQQSGGQSSGGHISGGHVSGGGYASGGHGSSGYNRSESSSWSSQGGSTYDQFGNKQFEADYAQHGLGAAALDHGFKTSSFDLGSLGVQESSQTSGGAHGAQGSSQWNAGQRGEGQQGGSRWESKSESSWSASGSGLPPGFHASATMIERDNVATDKPDLNNRFHGRRKRQLYEDIDIRNVMECKSTKCLMVRCTVGPLLNEQDAIIALRSRVNIRALRNISTSQSISFSSMMLARISKLPYIGKPTERQIHSHEIFTTVPAPEPDIKPDIVPLWVVVLAAVAGTVILLLLIFLLYKMGFFKRNRPSDAPERQPLNRNGYYQNGDAAL